MSDIIRNIVFVENIVDTQFIEVFLFSKDDDLLGIHWQNGAQSIVYPFIIKDRSKYGEFVEMLSRMVENCPNISSAHYKLKNFLEDKAYQYLDKYKENEYV